MKLPGLNDLRKVWAGVAVWSLFCCYAPAPAEVNPNSPIDANAHGKYFPITDADVHGAISCPECTCDACHGTAVSFTIVACATCHAHTAAAEQIDHNTVVNYVYESHACFICHPQASGAH